MIQSECCLYGVGVGGGIFLGCIILRNYLLYHSRGELFNRVCMYVCTYVCVFIYLFTPCSITKFFCPHTCVTLQRDSSVDITVSPLDEGVTNQDGLVQFLKVNRFDES